VDATNLRSKVQIGTRVRWDQNREPQSGRLPDGTLDCPAWARRYSPSVVPNRSV
jgi:hypothetical protein